MNAVAVLVHEDEPRIEYSFWYKVGGSMYRLVDRDGWYSVFTHDGIQLEPENPIYKTIENTYFN